MRKWLAFIAGLSLIVVSGVALGQTRAESPPTTVKEEKVVVAAGPDSVSPEVVRDTKWAPVESDDQEDEPKDEGPAEPPAKDEPEVDDTPPAIQILHPAEGQVFETKKVVFEGTSEPGARVFAGEYEADVDDAGNWRIVLFLSPGTNHATLRAKDVAGNVGEDSVTVVFKRVEEPKDEQEPPKDHEEQPPKDGEGEEVDWEFAAHQAYGECSETPPFDVFYGKGKPGSVIRVVSEYGDGEAEVNGDGAWELRVYFEGSPVGQGILVTVKDQFDHQRTFEFTHTAAD
jgi:hypothetical protein